MYTKWRHKSGIPGYSINKWEDIETQNGCSSRDEKEVTFGQNIRRTPVGKERQNSSSGSHVRLAPNPINQINCWKLEQPAILDTGNHPNDMEMKVADSLTGGGVRQQGGLEQGSLFVFFPPNEAGLNEGFCRIFATLRENKKKRQRRTGVQCRVQQDTSQTAPQTYNLYTFSPQSLTPRRTNPSLTDTINKSNKNKIII